MPQPLRLKWFGFQVPPGRLPALGRFMLKQQYGREAAAGFRLEHVQSDEIAGHYIERREYTEQVEDPAGDAVELRRIEFRQVGFRIRADVPTIEVVDSARDCRLLFQRLEEFYGEEMVIRPLSVDVLAWLQHFETRAGRAQVSAARLIDLALSTSVSASVVFTGTQDVRPQLKEWRRGRTGIVERVHIDLLHRGSDNWSVELVRDARAVVHAGGALAGTLTADALHSVLAAAASGAQAPAH